jgi:hypothetical protein
VVAVLFLGVPCVAQHAARRRSAADSRPRQMASLRPDCTPLFADYRALLADCSGLCVWCGGLFHVGVVRREHAPL